MAGSIATIDHSAALDWCNSLDKCTTLDHCAALDCCNALDQWTTLDEGLSKHQEVSPTPVTKVNKLVVVFWDLLGAVKR